MPNRPLIFQSTHLLRDGTQFNRQSEGGYGKFQSTHLLRGGTLRHDHFPANLRISIHPPPARWDFCPPPDCYAVPHFNPPTSCEVGRARPGQASRRIRDISIHPPPARWDMVRAFRIRIANGISIHPPPARWDERFGALGVGGADISIHPPPARWDHIIALGQGELTISIHPPPARWDSRSHQTLLHTDW